MPVIPIINKDLTLVGKELNDKIHEPKHQRNLVLIIVCVALLLDNMLYMVIVPIIPEYLYKMRQDENSNYTTLSRLATTTTKGTSISNDPFLLSSTKYFIDNNNLKNNVNLNKNQNKQDEEYYDDDETQLSNSMLKLDNKNETTKPVVLKQPDSTTTKSNNDDDDDSEEVAVGVLFASKAIVQLFVNPFSGAFIDRIGYDLPMCIGLCVIFVSTITFAFGQSYTVLFIARSLQGFGSAFADTSGLAMIADRFTEERERSTALGIALACISFGSLVAPPFGGILYEYMGKRVPFLSLAFIALLDSLLLFFVMRPHRIAMTLQQTNVHKPKGTPIWRLFIDPYIAICSGALVMANVSLAFLEPTIAIWMRNTMHATESQMGYIWLPGFIPHVIGVYFTVWMARKYPQYQWVLAAVGLALEGVSCFVIPFCHHYGVLMIPISGICFGIALVDTALLPTLGYLVDVRHTSVYGSIYAIADISYSLAYALGPIMAGNITHKYGFFALNMAICISNLLYAPMLYILRSFYQFKPLESNELNVISNNGSGPNAGTFNGGVSYHQRSNEDGYDPSLNMNYNSNYKGGFATNEENKSATSSRFPIMNKASAAIQSLQKYPKQVKNPFKDTQNLIDNMEENDFDNEEPEQSGGYESLR